MVLILIFAEVLGLYGCVFLLRLRRNLSVALTLEPIRLIVALIMNTRATGVGCS
jgi:hypothetical protein